MWVMARTWKKSFTAHLQERDKTSDGHSRRFLSLSCDRPSGSFILFLSETFFLSYALPNHSLFPFPFQALRSTRLAVSFDGLNAWRWRKGKGKVVTSISFFQTSDLLLERPNERKRMMVARMVTAGLLGRRKWWTDKICLRLQQRSLPRPPPRRLSSSLWRWWGKR